MRRPLAALLGALTISAALVGIGASIASAHQCPEGEPPDSEECHDTPVYDDYRGNYVPLFDLADRDGEDGEAKRRDAQRWRSECSNGGQERQQCAWVYGGTSIQKYDPTDGGHSDDPEDELLPRPNELHVGYAANHCFLAEAAHDCDGHNESEFGTHDSHGGAVYVDVCLSANPDSKHCDDGLEDTQVGVTVVDHLTCPVGCADEYHVVRPLDGEYTQRQMEDSAAAIDHLASDPVNHGRRHVCGYEENSYC